MGPQEITKINVMSFALDGVAGAAYFTPMTARVLRFAIVLMTAGCGSATSTESTIVDDSAASSHPDDPVGEQAVPPQEAGGASARVAVAPVPAPFTPEPVAEARERAIAAEFASGGTVRVLGRLPGDEGAVLATIVAAAEPYDPDCPECEDFSNDCDRTRLVRVLGEGGAASPLRIDGELRRVCPAADLSNMEIADFDSDGQLELRIVSETVMLTMADSRSGPGMEAGRATRAFYVSLDLRAQGSIIMSELYEDTGGMVAEERSEARLEYVDENADGFIDLGVRRFYSIYDCSAEDLTQLTPDDDCEAHSSRGVHRYDAESDSWGDYVELETERQEPAND